MPKRKLNPHLRQKGQKSQTRLSGTRTKNPRANPKTKEKLRGIWLVIAVICLAAVIYGVWVVAAKKISSIKTQQPLSSEIKATKVIQYVGKNDKTVLELLKETNDIREQKSDSGTFVTEINGIKNTDTEFWIYYVNGEIGLTSADKYVTKDGDKIEWRYESLR